MSTTKHLLLLVIVTIALPSCVSLKAVRDFASQAQVSTVKTPVIARDLVSTCKRRNKFEAVKMSCKSSNERRKRLLQTHRVLTAYMFAMGALAADDLSDYRASLKGLMGSIGQAGWTTNQQGRAVSALASFVAKLATQVYQQKALRDMIKSQNENVQIVIAGQKQIIGKHYAALLGLEEKSIKSFFRVNIREIKGRQRIMRLLASEYKNERLAEFIAKRKAIKAYTKVMNKIAAGHQDLYDGKHNLKNKTLLKNLKQHTEDLKRHVVDIVKAF